MLPVLLPYKPNGSEELFYIPQTEADFSSDTTMESSHPGMFCIFNVFTGHILLFDQGKFRQGKNVCRVYSVEL